MRTLRDPPAFCRGKEELERFGAIWKEVYGDVLEGDELEIAARYLVNLYVSVYGNPKGTLKT